MTDIAELVRRSWEGSHMTRPIGPPPCECFGCKIARTLEVQAKEIAELNDRWLHECARSDVLRLDVARLEGELVEMKEGYHRLDINWSSMHATSTDAIRSALGMPDASIPAMVKSIKEIKSKLSAVMDRNWEDEAEYYRHERSTPIRLSEWVRAKLGGG